MANGGGGALSDIQLCVCGRILIVCMWKDEEVRVRSSVTVCVRVRLRAHEFERDSV